MSDGEKKEFIVPLGPAGPDHSFPVARLSESSVAFGRMGPVSEGRPLGGTEILHVEPVGDTGAFEATVLYDGTPGRDGPAMVNSRAFLSGWDAVFGGQGRGRPAPN